MNAAESGRNTGAFLNESNAAVEIATAEENVIERCRKACDRFLRSPDGRRYDRASSDGKKSSSPKGFHVLFLRSKITLLRRNCGARFTLRLSLSRLASANVGAAALIFNFGRVGIALERVFDGKPRKAKIALDLFSGVEDHVQGNLVAPKIFFAQNFQTNVKSEKEEAARLERAEHFAK